MQVQHLEQSLDERRHPCHTRVRFQCLEEQIEVHSLLRRGDEPAIEKRVVERPVEAVGSGLAGLGNLEDEVERLNRGIESAGVSDSKQGVQVLVEADDYISD